jgi:hypothetical protein
MRINEEGAGVVNNQGGEGVDAGDRADGAGGAAAGIPAGRVRRAVESDEDSDGGGDLLSGHCQRGWGGQYSTYKCSIV